jgi:hypothetical protein
MLLQGCNGSNQRKKCKIFFVKDADDIRAASRTSFSRNQSVLRNPEFCIPQNNKVQIFDKFYLFVVNESCNH